MKKLFNSYFSLKPSRLVFQEVQRFEPERQPVSTYEKAEAEAIKAMKSGGMEDVKADHGGISFTLRGKQHSMRILSEENHVIQFHDGNDWRVTSGKSMDEAINNMTQFLKNRPEDVITKAVADSGMKDVQKNGKEISFSFLGKKHVLSILSEENHVIQFQDRDEWRVTSGQSMDDAINNMAEFLKNRPEQLIRNLQGITHVEVKDGPWAGTRKSVDFTFHGEKYSMTILHEHDGSTAIQFQEGEKYFFIEGQTINEAINKITEYLKEKEVKKLFEANGFGNIQTFNGRAGLTYQFTLKNGIKGNVAIGEGNSLAANINTGKHQFEIDDIEADTLAESISKLKDELKLELRDRDLSFDR